MELTLQRIIRKLELNENAISTIIGMGVMFIVASLFIGYFRDNRPTPELTQVSQVTPEVQTIDEQVMTGLTSSAATTRYTVQESDTLWSIAEAEYGDGHRWQDIAQANNLAQPNILITGTSLDLPRLADIVPDELAPTEAPDTYTVQQGDYLWSIAESVYGDGFQWQEIWQANQDTITNPQIIAPGTVLTLP